MATSSQRLNLRPTSRSMPTSSNPHLACRARDAAPDASMRANTEWKPEARGDLDEAGQQQLADAAARSWSRSTYTESSTVVRVGGPLLVRRQRGEADHRSGRRAVDGDDRREGARPRREPALLVGERPGDEVERAVAVRDLVVVDRADRLGVGDGGRPDRDRRAWPSAGDSSGARRALPTRLPWRTSTGPGCGRPQAAAMLARWFVAGPTRLATARSALLAQSAEHRHGKAGSWVRFPQRARPDGPRSRRPATVSKALAA